MKAGAVGYVLKDADKEELASAIRAAKEGQTESLRTDILPGITLLVEEVEPRVHRVVSDGVRDLAKANNTDIVAGQDGGIWLLRNRWFFPLGGEGHGL